MAALRLEDLLASQRQLRDRDARQQSTASMTVEELHALSKEMSATKDAIKKGLLDTSGGGLNSNIIELKRTIEESTKAKGAVVSPINAPVPAANADNIVSKTQQLQDTERARLEKASNDSAGKFQIGGLGFLKEEFKKLGSIKGWFDLSEGKSTGMLGQWARRRADKNDYIQNEMDVNPQLKTDPKYQNLSEKQKESAIRKDLGKQYERQQAIRGEQKQNQTRMAELRAAGKQESDLARGGYTVKQRELEERLVKEDSMAKRVREQDRAGISPVNIPSTPKAKATSILPSPVSTSVGTTEEEAENSRLMAEQTETLKQIEENTRGLKNLTGSKTTAPPDSGGGGGPGLMDLLGSRRLGRGIARVGRAAVRGIARAGSAIASGASSLVRGAGGLITRAAPAVVSAGTALASGASNLVSRVLPSAASTIPTATGAAAKALPAVANAGSGIVSAGSKVASGAAKVLGKLALPLAAGMAVYDGVQGWNRAGENFDVAEGQEATTGQKAASAGGSILSGLTFGLVDEKAASQGIHAGASYVGEKAKQGFGAVKSFFSGSSKDKADPVAAAPATNLTPPAPPPIVLGSGNMTDMIAGENGQKIEYRYSSGQPYVWTHDEIKEKVAILNKGGQVDIGTDFIPKDDKHINPAIKAKAMEAIMSAPLEEETPATPAAITPSSAIVPTPMTGDVVSQRSAENAEAAMQPASSVSAPVIVNAPSTVNNQTSVSQKSPARNTESSYQQYNRMKYAMSGY